MKRLALLIPLLLSCCETDEERKQTYMDFCTTHEFSKPQCEVLYMNKQSSDNATAAATAAQFQSGAALGASIATSGVRR